jgi:hypothetical protein
VRSIEKQLRREAKRLRARADGVDWLASKIEANRLADKPITQNLLWRVLLDGEGAGRYYVAKLAAVEHYVGADDEAPLRPSAETPSVPVPAPKIDALSQATAIARSSAGEDGFAWTREPLTERERSVRAHWIAKHLEDRLGCAIISGTALSIRLSRLAIPSDLAAAEETAKQLMDSHRIAEERSEFQRISDELDGKDGDSDV